MQTPPTSHTDVPRKPKVLIVGAGLGGLMLAILLQRAGIPFTLFERSGDPRPLGSILSLNAVVIPIFQQLGVLDQLLAITLPIPCRYMYDHDLNQTALVQMPDLIEQVGHPYLAVDRPSLYSLLLSLVPPGCILFNKRITNMSEYIGGVSVSCADKDVYHGDILVGADGVHSAVRQIMFKRLEELQKLPLEDTEALTRGYITVLGTTRHLDPERFKGIATSHCDFSHIFGNRCSYTWSTLNVPGNRICWSIHWQTDASTGEDHLFRSSGWDHPVAQDVLKACANFKTVYGVPLGDFFKETPGDGISMVFLEEKLFKTWHFGRTGLIGDACHKMLPSSGQGAVNAFHDAIILANLIYEYQPTTSETISAMFEEFKTERFERIEKQYSVSRFQAMMLYGQDLKSRVLRHLALKHLPKWVQTRWVLKMSTYRPQASFLPRVPNAGTLSVEPQPESERYRREQAKCNIDKGPIQEQVP
ncbi:MAG: hypothetical protein J3Q66DRAFT_322913 [Benniella sp.]|nr:MAG: hypothetical protein J3Q66DRAFT_322913 [Benniella sp.]